MSITIGDSAFVKISELEERSNFSGFDEFVFVHNDTTLKIKGQAVTDSLVSLGNLASKGYVDAIVAGAPGLLDTLDELAAALGDDANFASNITNLINTKVSSANFSALFDSSLATKNTHHIIEGSNLYHTSARARASVFNNDDIIKFNNGGELGNSQGVHQDGNYLGMDIYSPSTHAWVQMNYDDSNYIYLTNNYAGIDVGIHHWEFDEGGALVLPGEGLIKNQYGNVLLPASNPQFETVFITGDITHPSHAATKSYVDNNSSSISSIGDIANVIITEPTAGQVLKFNGSTWVNGTDAIDASGGSSTDPVFNTVNVQNINFTGTGAVNITSGNDLNFIAAGDIRLNGQPTISLTTLKSILAASSDFNDFKTRIATL